MKSGLIDRYRDLLPVTDATPSVSLGEGSTPLVRSQSIGDSLGCKDLYFKLEGCNPTGSFKDRGMVMAIAKALEAGKKRIICASTGNTSAAAAAYGARYGLETLVLVPAGEIALGKLAQAMAYGARILAVNGSFDDALNAVRSIVEVMDIELVNSVNPYRIEGQKTGAFEIIDELGAAPDMLCIPVGNAGNITAYWKGFNEYQAMGRAETTPKMMGFQAAGAAPIVRGEPVLKPETIATAIRIGNPASWEKAEAARDESEGMIDMVDDNEIVDAYLRLAREEGIFCEPASSASVAGLIKLPELGVDLTGKTVVCILTGNGLKDPGTAEKRALVELEYVEPDIDSVMNLLNSGK
ncbi:threonine synthase [Candidatus Lucifugimonas marina]|jgi:threonine synthase|uniref:Threonine synthase n=1 Tax=Candidatus Lucifugimonas marina TaxID=3038979 RepID=A0AAJ5ZIS8_9CHLR|nr:threonine synthase [SAR202 cluster bacterium JH702]MDG0870263.1 threonine synthase [SAR202 cluster bacterium JH639]WFG36861.1 threonine synthase [SAR202 cluster bacterium JH545]WFG40799.1 threonine synthase [SAR202 cluster bacterium JH1073]